MLNTSSVIGVPTLSEYVYGGEITYLRRLHGCKPRPKEALTVAGIDFKAAAAAVSCKEFAEAEGLAIRHNRIACPFHGGKGYNFALYADGRGHCFVCGRDADSVQLAAAVWRMNQRDAAVEMNRRFNLHLDGKQLTAAELDRIHHQRRQRDLKQQAAEDALQGAQAEAAAAWAAVNACDTTSADYSELLRRAKNADVWTDFKRMELQMATAGRC